MDFLPCHFTYRTLVGAFCLAFAQLSFASVFTPIPLYWSPTSSGSFAVPSIPATQLQAADSSFSTVDSAVQQDVVTPVLQFSGSNALDLSGDINAIRSIPISSIVNSLTNNFANNAVAFQSLLNAPSLASLLPTIYDDYESSLSSSGSSSGSSSSTYYCGSLLESVPSPYYYISDGSSVCNGTCNSSSGCYGYTPNQGSCDNQTMLISSNPSCSNADSASLYPNGASSPPPPSDLSSWIPANWSKDDLSNFTAQALDATPYLATDVADAESNDSSTPVVFPNAHPWDYVVPAADASVSGPSSTVTSTNPSTGDTTKTVTTPSYSITGGNSVTVTKSSTAVTSTCTSSGTCTQTGSTTTSSTPTLSPNSSTPPSSPFTAPTTSTPASQTASIKSFALNLAMPSQSDAVCPDPLSFTALSNNFTIPLTPLCNLATDVNPYVESLGAVGAGIIIFR